jgi:kynurenine formamidase
MDIVDLTLPLGAFVDVQPGDPPFAMTRTRSHQADGFEVTQICLGSHTGTHIDAPRHFFPEGAPIDAFPLDRLMGPGVVLDCRPAAEHERLSRLREQLGLFPLAQDGIAILWAEGAHISQEIACLLREAGAGLVGTDAPSLDADPFPAHRLLLASGVLIVENLRGLDRLGVGPVECAFLPLALTGTDGAPIRAVAWR